MEYIQNSKQLSKFKFKKNEKIFFDILYKLSKTIENIHKDSRNIIIGDLGFYNVLFQDNNIYLCDIDSARIDKYDADRTTLGLFKYYKSKNEYLGLVTKNTDKICLYLETIKVIFNKEISKLEMKEYDKLSEKIDWLKNMKEILIDMKKSKYIPTVPYIHELIKK